MCEAYIFSYLLVENRTHVFNKFKELDLCWYCQMLSQDLSFTWIFTPISNKFSQHWRAAWNLASTSGPRVGQHWIRHLLFKEVELKLF